MLLLEGDVVGGLMASEGKYIASFFTSKRTTIDYYQKGDRYFFKDGLSSILHNFNINWEVDALRVYLGCS